MEWSSTPEMVVARVGDCCARVCVSGDLLAPLFIRWRDARDRWRAVTPARKARPPHLLLLFPTLPG
jgi:hypothetical protein